MGHHHLGCVVPMTWLDDDEPTGGPYTARPFCMLPTDDDKPCHNEAVWLATWKLDERIQFEICEDHYQDQQVHPDPYVDVTYRRINQ